jgi:hypothetical protein
MEATEGVQPAAPKAKKPKAKAKAKSNGKPKSKGKGRARTGVGETVKKLLAAHPNWTNQEIAEKALKACPGSSTNAQCVAWYKSQGGKKPAKKK